MNPYRLWIHFCFIMSTFSNLFMLQFISMFNTKFYYDMKGNKDE